MQEFFAGVLLTVWIGMVGMMVKTVDVTFERWTDFWVIAFFTSIWGGITVWAFYSLLTLA